MRVSDKAWAKRSMSGASQCSDSVHLAVKNDETRHSAIAFLRKAAAACPFQLTHVLTDNARRQRVLDGRTPNQVIAEYLKAKPELVNPAPHGRAGPCDTTKARLIAEAAKEVSQQERY